MVFHHDDEKAPQTLVGISFPDIFRAQEFLTAATGLAAKDKLKLLDAVLVLKDDEGKTTVRETIDPQPGRTAMSGAVWTGLLGLLLGGPVGWIAGAAIGAGAGAVTAKVVDLGVSDAWVEWFRDEVAPGTATVVLLVSHLDQQALVAEAERFTGARLVYANLAPSAIEQLKSALDDPTPPITGGAESTEPLSS